MKRVTKAVIPAAGLGTRFLPATKALPKEMLPVVDKPAIQYVVEEAVNAGLNHVLMITGRNKNALENHFDRAVELEGVLSAKGDENRLGVVYAATDLADIHYVRQGDALGLGHAISKARTFVGEEPFAVLLGDDILDDGGEALKQMAAIAVNKHANVVALMEVPETEVSKYGIASTANTSGVIIELNGLVEKPEPDLAPSNLAVIGRYILQPEIFEVLRNISPGQGGEIQLTDALNLMAKNPEISGPVYGFVYSGKRFDTGDKVSYLKAIVEIAVARDDIGSEFQNWLIDYVPTLKR